MFPEGLDIARQNRRFLYRAVRHLAQVEGLEQFLDLGSGLPSGNNVHEIAQTFRPKAHRTIWPLNWGDLSPKCPGSFRNRKSRPAHR
nr:SAM-dependent methyltransferase [Allosalinactinospora lopnorensis]